MENFQANSLQHPIILFQSVWFKCKSSKDQLCLVPFGKFQLYHYAISVLRSTWKSIKTVWSMNDCAAQLYPDCEFCRNLGLTKFHFWNFFWMYKGKLIAEVSKPCLTKDKRRMCYCLYIILKSKVEVNQEMIVCFLGKNCFFALLDKKMKILPKA